MTAGVVGVLDVLDRPEAAAATTGRRSWVIRMMVEVVVEVVDVDVVESSTVLPPTDCRLLVGCRSLLPGYRFFVWGL